MHNTIYFNPKIKITFKKPPKNSKNAKKMQKKINLKNKNKKKFKKKLLLNLINFK